MTSRWIFLIATICVAVAAAVWIGKGRNKSAIDAQAPSTAPLGSPALPGFTFAGQDVTRDSTVYTLTNSSGSVARIEVLEHIEAADAETLVQDGVMGMQALYANALSAYPGDISNKIATDPAFQPRLVHLTNSAVRYTYMLLYANDRFGYGATTRDSVKYKSLIGWFFCEDRKEFFKVKLFAAPSQPDNSLERTLTSLRCRQGSSSN